ncbi:MAG: N-acetyltransferase family protein [Tumebacillaceae bacterium]
MARNGKENAKQVLKKTAKPRGSQQHEQHLPDAPLTFRNRREGDDAFLLRVTMAAMKQVYEKSTGTELTEESVLENIRNSGTTVIIERGGKPIGYYSYTVYLPGRMYWGSLILSPDRRGKGVGPQIHRHVEAEARKRNVRVIEGHVQVENKRAYEFWMKSGWRVVRMEGPGTLAIEKAL